MYNFLNFFRKRRPKGLITFHCNDYFCHHCHILFISYPFWAYFSRSGCIRFGKTLVQLYILFSDYQGAYLLGVSEGSLESPNMPWKESFKETYSCLQFKYILPGTTTEGRNSTLEVFVGNEEQMALLWRVQGYHGNKSSRGYVSWESKKDVMVTIMIIYRE